MQIMWVVLFVTLLAGTSASAKEEPGQVVFRADYENRQVTSGVKGLAADSPKATDALNVDCALARTGKCSLVTRVRMRDDYVSAGAHRAETSTSRIPETLYGPGEKFRYRFSLALDPSWSVDSRDSIDSVWQFKRFESQPDMFVAVKGNTIVWRIADLKQITLIDGLPLGEWLDFEFVIRWSDTGDGTAELTMRRGATTQTFRHDGRNLRDARPDGGYVKWGLYKPGQLGRKNAFLPRIVHHDDIEIVRLP